MREQLEKTIALLSIVKVCLILAQDNPLSLFSNAKNIGFSLNIQTEEWSDRNSVAPSCDHNQPIYSKNGLKHFQGEKNKFGRLTKTPQVTSLASCERFIGVGW